MRSGAVPGDRQQHQPADGIFTKRVTTQNPTAQFPLVEPGSCRNRSAMISPKITAETIRAMKGRGEKIAALTAYDFPMTRLLDEVGIPLILVGDSLGMVVLGYPDTTHVTMSEMEHHVRAAARAEPRALLVADMPYHSYLTVADAVQNAR